MGKKAKLYLLVLVNLMVWGYVGYKVYGALQGDDDLDFIVTQTKIKSIEKPLEEKIELLSLNYDDPFLKRGDFSGNPSTDHSSNPNRQHQGSTTQQQVLKASKINTVVPISIEIKYMGLVQNSSNGNITALLSVNGKSVFIKQNDIIEGYVIKNISNDAILATKGKEKLVIRK